ncbi:MAG: fused MFS/spermidine synthase [Myxococcales bacterium]|jgi:predicted membrane-bound spermidine synthase|nr:fused MFS/spermidine synthase [Myxococcales bacterium]
MARPSVLFYAGVNLALVQLLSLRELSIALSCGEIVILVVTASYFFGQAVGYLASRRLSDRAVRGALFGAAALHVPLVPFVRWFAASCEKADAPGWVVPLASVPVALALTGVYTVFLPRLFPASGAKARDLARAYTTELAGFAAGFVIVGVFPRWTLTSFALVYGVVLVLLARSAAVGARAVAATAALASLVALTTPWLDRESEHAWVRSHATWLKEPRVVHEEHTPYQKIMVTEQPDGSRALFLNGIEYFDSTDLEAFNVQLSRTPVALRPGGNVLIVGGGSLSNVYHASSRAGRITTVELDGRVVEVGKAWFERYNHLGSVKVPWRVVVDDAKHFLATTDERFDVVIVDVPAPFYVQTALLFTREFYELVRARLTDRGILSAYLAGLAGGKDTRIPGQVLAAVDAVFPEYFVIDSKAAANGFVLASARPVATPEELLAVLEGLEVNVYPREATKALSSKWPPASFGNLDIVWDINNTFFAPRK